MSTDIKFPEEARMDAIERQLKGFTTGQYVCEHIKSSNSGEPIRERCKLCLEWMIGLTKPGDRWR